jgi:hypothetical protein
MKLQEIIELTEGRAMRPIVTSSLNLNCEYDPRDGWRVVDQNSYDGAPDGNDQMGHGNSKMDAVNSLLDQLVQDGVYSDSIYDEVDHALRRTEYGKR